MYILKWRLYLMNYFLWNQWELNPPHGHCKCLSPCLGTCDPLFFVELSGNDPEYQSCKPCVIAIYTITPECVFTFAKVVVAYTALINILVVKTGFEPVYLITRKFSTQYPRIYMLWLPISPLD